MRILIVEDDPLSRLHLQTLLREWHYDIDVACDGEEGVMLFHQTKPQMILLDWVLPGISGLEVCARIRDTSSKNPPYIIFVTGKGGSEEIVEGLKAGANDYVSKPYNESELRARIQVGERMLSLQHSLAERVQELEEAAARIKVLSGLLPICAYCKKVRDDQGYWTQVESYVSRHSAAVFSHGICPECLGSLVQKLEKQKT
jgi:sigma-B regulation protein RsbU (phosphoserine phosphatase)